MKEIVEGVLVYFEVDILELYFFKIDCEKIVVVIFN